MRALEKYERSTFVFNVRVDDYDLSNAINQVSHFITEWIPGRTRQVLFTNVHSIQLAQQNPELLNCINHADLVLADGSGLKIAGKLFGYPIKENLNGTDFIPHVLEQADKNGWSVYLLGATDDVVMGCSQNIKNKYPRLKIAGFRNGYFQMEEEHQIVNEINQYRPDILLVALGSPKQEEWIAHHRRSLNTRVCLGVGGLFDFLSGKHKRAPLWMRQLGIEWAFRFVQSPQKKWDRIFVDIPLFLVRVFFDWMWESTVRLRQQFNRY
ncbi:MAG TPA: WecB/TagA/CpsF family glycosyltransferase [Balneolales bacterium]|nr:WecB/TagA/CpsF family glycosyltransferase [Balneolales bacterium]